MKIFVKKYYNCKITLKQPVLFYLQSFKHSNNSYEQSQYNFRNQSSNFKHTQYDNSSQNYQHNAYNQQYKSLDTTNNNLNSYTPENDFIEWKDLMGGIGMTPEESNNRIRKRIIEDNSSLVRSIMQRMTEGKAVSLRTIMCTLPAASSQLLCDKYNGLLGFLKSRPHLFIVKEVTIPTSIATSQEQQKYKENNPKLNLGKTKSYYVTATDYAWKYRRERRFQVTAVERELGLPISIVDSVPKRPMPKHIRQHKK